jgi:FHS family L-fucose permease-like MFS transporter
MMLPATVNEQQLPDSDPLVSATGPTPPATRQAYRAPLAIMNVLFFMWGFVEILNDVLIPHFKEAFQLNYFQSTLVQQAYFSGYFISSLIYYITSTIYGDPINRIGYKNGAIVGMLIAASGCLLFYPAALAISYPFFLLALFVLGWGMALLQITSNPYVTILGPESTASSRLNLAQGFNSLGTTISPVIGAWLIFTAFANNGGNAAQSVKFPYLGLAGVFLVLAAGFKSVNLPAFSNKEKIVRGLGALKHPHTVLGMSAIFMYVGGEVSVGSMMINYLGLPKLGALSHETASHFLSLYWAGFMIGRFMGGFALSSMSKLLKNSLVALVPVAAFFAVWILFDKTTALRSGVALLLLLVAFYLGEASAHRMLGLFGSMIVVMLLTTMLSGGELAKWSILSIGLFGSIMWSNIFSLAIEGLGPLKSQASSLLIMAVVGAAVLPPLQGLIADNYGIQKSFIVPLLAFCYIAYYGFYGYKVGRHLNHSNP